MENAQIEVRSYTPSSGRGPHEVEASDGKTYKFWPNNPVSTNFSEQSVNKTYVVEYIEEPGKGNYGPSLMLKSAVLQPDEDIPFDAPTNGSAQPSYQPSQPQTNHQSTTLHQSDKDKIITRLAIAKSCIESNKTLDDANKWLNWVYDDYRG